MNKKQRYQDYVIKDGNLVGDFESLYKEFEDPWNQSTDDQIFDSRRVIISSWCNKLRIKYQSNRVVELGCGFGHITESLRQQKFSTVGIDISEAAITRARQMNPNSVFLKSNISDFEMLKALDPDIILMPELTWYILKELDVFLSNLKDYASKRIRPVFLIHLLAIYPPGIQKYGSDKFTNQEEILKYFKLEYLESGIVDSIKDGSSSLGTYFVAKVV